MRLPYYIFDALTMERKFRYCDLGTFSWPATRINDRVYVTFRNSGSVAIFTPDGQFLQRYALGDLPLQPTVDEEGNI